MRASQMILTTHARVRMQQRGIRPEALEALLDEGRVAHDHRGAEIVYFGGAARRRLPGKLRGTYAVLGTDGVVITVGHRLRRIKT